MPTGLTYTGSGGTRVNAQGYIESVANNVPRFDYDPTNVTVSGQNLLLQSNSFTAATWNKSGCTISADGTLAPDGSAATKVITNSGSGFGGVGLIQTVTLTGLSYATSIVAKAGGLNRIQVQFSASPTNGRAFFDLASGTVSSVLAGTATITSLGSGWYKCTVIVTSTVGSIQMQYLPTDGTLTTGDGVAGVYVANAQLNEGSTALAYTATTTAAIAGTRVANMLKGLLIEESRTNRFQRSSEFDNAYWTKSNSTVTANQATALDGTVSADLLVWGNGITAGNATLWAGNGTNGFINGSTQFSTSIYIKSAGSATIRIMPFSTPQLGSANYSVFTLTGAGSVVNPGNSVGSISYVRDGWYRCSMYGAFGYDANGVNLILLNDATGNGTSGVYIWGAQTEPGSFPTSYIPTTTASVTRAADMCYTTSISSFFNPKQGSIFAEFSVPHEHYGGVSFNDGLVAFAGGTGNILLAERNGTLITDGLLYAGIRNGTPSAIALTNLRRNGAINRAGMNWNTDASGNGIITALAANGSVSTALQNYTGVISGTTTMYIGFQTISGSSTNRAVHMRKVLIFPRTLPSTYLLSQAY